VIGRVAEFEFAPFQTMSKHEVVEMGGLMDGAEDWDWDDMIEDIGEPQSNEKEVCLCLYLDHHLNF
jgi:hypothetical protein